jgi:hypothetical protein
MCSILLGFLTAPSCEEDDPCGQACFSRFTLYVRATPPATFAVGPYTLEALVDGNPVSCNFTVAADRTVHFNCGEREILAAPDLIFVTFPGTPAELDISLWSGTTAILEQSVAPEYEMQNPNCQAGCEAADMEFLVAP